MTDAQQDQKSTITATPATRHEFTPAEWKAHRAESEETSVVHVCQLTPEHARAWFELDTDESEAAQS